MSKEISDNPGASRYEVRVDGSLAGFAEYRTRPGKIVFTHTEVDGAYEGQGVGSALARGALDDVRAKGLAVVPLCPFIKGWIDKHPDYQDLVA
ncbi:GNAT family N-acetyltransferase [Actinomadura viridis]|uniref:GNAT family acetyltransferase n=1 Tax=Actinomadura viridis TaxID=58110 RepID=A0A931GHQ2_9ACTN|nr:GNAT family N-acetyltransferase [Actinomadura viridis]MBG6087678.1 putative GNAT family acetyltransferase [Actinomadura viridis]